MDLSTEMNPSEELRQLSMIQIPFCIIDFQDPDQLDPDPITPNEPFDYTVSLSLFRSDYLTTFFIRYHYTWKL